MGGIVTPEEVGPFQKITLTASLSMCFCSSITSMRFVDVSALIHDYDRLDEQLIITQEFARTGRRGYGDGE